jgi:biotin synthase-related radical SAM superfamily protein
MVGEPLICQQDTTCADPDQTRDLPAFWRVSSGSAAVLGLRAAQMDAAPTTAYLMLGERCCRNCAFCTQARESAADAESLSRVHWPAFALEQIVESVSRSFAQGRIRRACFQVTASEGYMQAAREAVAALAQPSAAPICVSIAAQDVADVESLLQAGAQRVTLALDAACERVYRQVKGGSWGHLRALLETCARLYPGRIGTHLIVGLGETEREMVACIQDCVDLGISVALFAFTPVAGTRMAAHSPPPLAQYRRIQAARWLIVERLTRAEHIRYDAAEGRILALGLADAELRQALASGEAFRTSGCPDCNRPYYNERPGGVLYNYPRPLNPQEARQEVDELLHSLQG